MKPLLRKEVLGCYRFYGLSEEDMLMDLGDKQEYNVDLACHALESRVDALGGIWKAAEKYYGNQTRH